MATASTVRVDFKKKPVYAVPDVSADAAEKLSQLLQVNHDKFHIFFNADGFHDHIAHHLPSIYALGASPETLQRQFDGNSSYQRPLRADVEKDMSDEDQFDACLGKGTNYRDFLSYFEQELDKHGWQNVLNDMMFSRSVQAEKMFARLLDGALHPQIHLGFGIEFEQPALIAEALAETAVHSDGLANAILFLSEKLAKERGSGNSESLMKLLGDIRKNEKLLHCVRPEDGNKIREGVIARAHDEVVELASRFSVQPTEADLRQKLRQMIELCAYFTFASQRPTKAVKMDFFYMHSMNASLFFERFISADWLSLENKARLLEWKARFDLMMYISRGCPELNIDEIREYFPKMLQEHGNGLSADEQWQRLFRRARDSPDDGHISKLLRACKVGEALWIAAENEKIGRPGEIITTDMWLKMGHMTVDSTVGSNLKWVRSTGLDEAWTEVEKRDNARTVHAAL